MSEASYNPFSVLEHADSSPDAVNAAHQTVVHTFDQADPAGVARLLASPNQTAVARGLAVFGALGTRGRVLVDAALSATPGQGVLGRSNLMDGMLCYPGALSAKQVSSVLSLADDPEELVRQKVVAFVAALEDAILADAIGYLTGEVRSAHSTGLDVLRAFSSDAQSLFDAGVEGDRVQSIYLLASVERMAMRGLVSAVHYHGDSYLANAVAANVARIARRFAR